MGEEFKEFTNRLLKRGPHKKKITNSYGRKEAHHYYTLHRPKEDKYIVSMHTYGKLINRINSLLVEELLKGYDIILPQKMGKIEIRRKEDVVRFEDGLVITNRPIDWPATHKYWYENPAAREKKELIHLPKNPLYQLIYNRKQAIYTNKTYFTISFNRGIKLKLKDALLKGKLDAFKLY